MSTSKLIVHCGGQTVDRQQLSEVATPAATDTWVPVPHIEVVNQVEASLTSFGMRVVSTGFALAKEGARFFGLMQVARQEAENKDYGYVVGLRNSHDKAFRLTMGVGSSVFACDNLAFSSEIEVTRKHTSRIAVALPGLIGSAVGMLAEKWNDQGTRLEAYRTHEITDSQANDLIVRSYELGACPILTLPAVIKEWKTPRHPEFAENRNVWRLFNAFTEGLKGNLWALPKRTQVIHGLMDTAAGILVKEQALNVVAQN